MKRLVYLVIAVAIATLAAWYAWDLSQRASITSVSVLLPRKTIFLAHMPDFNRTRDQWHHSDIYLLYREPAVQDFLRKPLASLSTRDTASQTLREIEQLDPKDAFFALTSLDDNSPKLAGGFRFHGSVADAERLIGKWRSKLLERNAGAKHEKLQYERHEIDLIASSPFTLATAYDGPWFFAATDLTDLKAMLDRADRRAKDLKETLTKDEAYRTVVSHRPSDYAAFFYLQPKPLFERLAALRAAIQPPGTSKPNTFSGLEQVQSISGATRFENGKIYDLLFLGMPNLDRGATLTRSSLALGTKETFFCLAMLLNLGEKIDVLNRTPGIGGAVQNFFQSLSDSGVTKNDWNAAFGSEVGWLADWPPSAHWPSLLLTLPVTDIAKASNILEAITRADESAVWTQTEKDGVRYFSMQSLANLVAITPTIALSEKVFVAGSNPVSVEEAVKRSGGGTSSELADSNVYKTAARLVPAPTNFFAYVDTALLYSRLDASLRPMLLMATVFMPALTKWVDLGKLPSPEGITKHLSPIVSSQRYDRDGYVAESIGPITLDQSVIGLAILSGISATARQKAVSALSGPGTAPPGNPKSSASPSPTP
jgi:hypothetical protein